MLLWVKAGAGIKVDGGKGKIMRQFYNALSDVTAADIFTPAQQEDFIKYMDAVAQKARLDEARAIQSAREVWVR